MGRWVECEWWVVGYGKWVVVENEILLQPPEMNNHSSPRSTTNEPLNVTLSLRLLMTFSLTN